MAFDQVTRNRLQRFVNDARRVLEEEFTRQLQNDYGMDPNAGTIAELTSLRHINDAQRETARILRDTLAHYTASGDMNARQGLDRIVREQAFTVLNRLAALRMAESRGLLVESVGNGFQAKGFQLYARLAGTGLGETGDAYRVYLFSVFDELAQDLPGLFDRYSPQGRLFPREAALLQVLNLINDNDIAPLWSEDETIGWIYQYFNSKEERKAMREASQAPRNSRELAVRNQFFTPRYVVEFLVDNTLGRLWFNATGGATHLHERCQYLLVKPDETSQAATKLRDPRTLKLLDPACGSMHFGLYAFDLFAEIYREAWTWEKEHGPGSLDVSTQPQAAFKPLSQTYKDEAAFLRDVPRLIIEHNIYGVDIDPRAAQIASLALWLRAQRAWHDAGVKAKDRPLIGCGHVVAAIAPPAERELRQQFAGNLDQRDAELFEKTLQLLKGLPELGVLLQVERELPDLIRQVYVGKGTGLFAEQEQANWQQAEARLRDALTEFAQAAKSTYQGRLFAQDALQGLRLIDLCREVFDVVVMNPPFGEPPEKYRQYLKDNHPSAADNLAVCFMDRCKAMLSSIGRVGAITDCSWAKKFDYKDFRSKILVEQDLQAVVHLGWGVLDNANVETNITIRGLHSELAFYADVSTSQDKAWELQERVSDNSKEYFRDYLLFKKLPNSAFVFEMSEVEFLAYSKSKRVSQSFMNVVAGVKSCNSTADFRLWWEVMPGTIGKEKDWWLLHNGSPYCPFHYPVFFTVRSDKGKWTQLMANGGARPGEAYYQHSGVVYGKRTDTMYGYIKHEGEVFSQEGQCSFPKAPATIWGALALMNSSVFAKHANYVAGQHKYHNYLNNICLNVESIPLDSLHARMAHSLLSSLDSANENTLSFVSPVREEFDLRRNQADRTKAANALISQTNQFRKEIDIELCANLKVDLLHDGRTVDYYEHYFGESFSPYLVGSVWFSYFVGLAFGRWDTGDSTKNEELHQSDQFPFAVILTDDLDPDFGIENRIQKVIHRLFNSHAGAAELEICQCLGVPSFKYYLAKPQAFFADHLRRYSKSRRQAPIYWPLSTTSGSYTLWVYYSSLNSQTLYTAINDFVEPKLKQVGSDVSVLRNKGTARTGDDEKQFEALQAFELELIELRDTLLKLAPTYKPNHDDGVQISAAPLWPLFRHKPWQKVLRETWTKLEKGDYDWAHLAMNYWPERVREKCKTDKSLAIAHGLEHLYVEPEVQAKKIRGRKKAGGDE